MERCMGNCCLNVATSVDTQQASRSGLGFLSGQLSGGTISAGLLSHDFSGLQFS
jgi:hypothetical protein